MNGNWMKMAALSLVLPFAATAETDPANWQDVLEKAEGQTVYWNAWGDRRIPTLLSRGQRTVCSRIME